MFVTHLEIFGELFVFAGGCPHNQILGWTSGGVVTIRLFLPVTCKVLKPRFFGQG